jgi:hypothetical protein
MHVGLFDAIRIQSLELIFNKEQKFIGFWDDSYSSFISNHLIMEKEEGFRDRLISLGGVIRDVFRSNKTNARGGVSVSESQSAMSAGGTSWERMVVWYLNALGSGLNMIALNKKGQSSFLPVSFLDAFCVTVNNASTSSDLDVVALNWIGSGNQDWMDEVFDSNKKYDMKRAKKIFINLVDSYPDNFSVCVLSTKTNWNDNIQTPMLWNLVFTKGFHHPLVSVGRNQCSTEQFGYFSYGFATVPTSRYQSFTHKSTPVIRASTFSAGSYWGLPADESKRMLPLSEIFGNRTMMPTGRDVGENLFDFLSEVDGREAFRL